MTDRIKGLTIYFDSLDIREDCEYIKELKKALKCFKHVHSVRKIVSQSEDYFAYDKGYRDALDKVYESLHKMEK